MKSKNIIKLQKAGVISKALSLVRKPSTLEVIHRSPYKFNINEFYKGTEFDFGLHAGTPTEALGDVKYKLVIPKPTITQWT